MEKTSNDGLYEKIRAMVQKDIHDAISDITDSKSDLTQYGVAKAPSHSHNGVDLPQLPPTSLSNVVVLSAQPQGVLNGAMVSNLQLPVAVFPIPSLGGPPSGSAPNGTLVMASDTGIPKLYMRFNNAWVAVFH